MGVRFQHLTACGLLAAGVIAGLAIARQTDPGRTGRGAVRVQGGGLADDNGSLTVLGATLFWGAWGYRHDRPRLERNLAFLADHGVDAIRVLGVVGPANGWEDRAVDPAWPDYDDVVTGLTDVAFDRYGLRVQWTIFGGIELAPTQTTRAALVRRFRRLLEPRADKVLFVELANEGDQTGFDGAAGMDELRRLGHDLADSNRLLVALTAPRNGDPGAGASSPGEMTLDHLYRSAGVDISGIDVATFHYDRDIGGPGAAWQPARQPWRAARLRRSDGALASRGIRLPPVLASNEPIGPGSSVASETDPARLVASALVAWIAGHAVSVYHSGAGVRGGGSADRERGRPANVFEVDGAAAQLDALARARDALPADIASWSPVLHGPANDGGHADDRLFGGPAARDVYCARRGVEFTCAAIALEDSPSLEAAVPMRVSVLDPVSGSAGAAIELDAGTLVPIEGHPAVVVLRGTTTALE